MDENVTLYRLYYTVDYAPTVFKIISNFPSLFEKYHGKSMKIIVYGDYPSHDLLVIFQ
jgi:hypothetical protein